MVSRSKNTSSPIKRPPLFKYVGEHLKVWNELRKFYKFKKTFNPPPTGDGHPILILPGFMASDFSTGHFRTFLKQLGYTPYTWDLGRNYGNISQLNILLKKIQNLHEEHQAKVSLIGWSLGGVYARQLAKVKPDLIRQVITLGSPFAGIHEPNNVVWLYKLINGKRKISENDKKWMENIAGPAPVPTTALYSKDDGIVPWEACMEPIEDELHQNIEIKGTHLGLGFNPAVWTIVEDRLKYTAENWQAYP
jgi:PGAP1-like protein